MNAAEPTIDDAKTEVGVAAGSFGAWLTAFRASLKGDGGTDVPCGSCVGCCVSSYHIPIRTSDRNAVAKIPPGVLFRVSGQPEGHAMMGFRADGSCPMLTEGRCGIYHDRPQTCRDYDCRIFAAAGIDAGGEDKHVINARVRDWRFSYTTEEERRMHDAVRAAASFIRLKKTSFPNERVPTAPTGIAVLAVKCYALFLDEDRLAMHDTEIALAIIHASGQFDAE
jgi:Fe-S-cluster containining protein